MKEHEFGSYRIAQTEGVKEKKTKFFALRMFCAASSSIK